VGKKRTGAGEVSAATADATQGGGSPAAVALGRRSRGHRRRFHGEAPTHHEQSRSVEEDEEVVHRTLAMVEEEV
jgi:hypothetical protein